MFDGLRSRWMIPFWWACWMARQTGMKSSIRSRMLRRLGIAILRDRDALDQLHGEVGHARCGRPGVKHASDVRVVHHRQRLALAFEARDHLRAVHPRLDHFHRHVAANGVKLLRTVDHAHSAFAELSGQSVRSDQRAAACVLPIACARDRVGRGAGSIRCGDAPRDCLKSFVKVVSRGRYS